MEAAGCARRQGRYQVSANVRMLIVEDEEIVRSTMRAYLEHNGFVVAEAGTLAAARVSMREQRPSLVLLDLQLPDGDGLDLLTTIKKDWPEMPVVVMTGHGSIETAVTAMRRGADNFIQKPLHFDQLLVSLRQALKTGELRRRVAEDVQRTAARYRFEDIVADSPSMHAVIKQARIVVAESRATTLLLLGETGTGKGLLAGAIHYASTRAREPFQKVICSAIPESLLEAELFGHERGAFTDAKQQRRGVFEAADRGTVFLDEIGDMPVALQSKLLGILEDRSFRRIGGSSLIEVDVRIIAATHRDLQKAVADGSFREDLYYRLNVVPLTIPPLRERHDDILPLARSFVEEFNRGLGRRVGGIADDAEARLLEYPWPGNVRELRNVIERAMLFSSCETLSAADLFLDMGTRPQPVAPAPGGGARLALPREGLNLEEHERDLVRQAMEFTGDNQSRAAALLGISRDQIRYRLEKMGALRGSSRARRGQ